MSSMVLLLLIIGLIFLGFEVFLPGAVLGILGGICLLVAVGLAFLQGGSSLGILTLGIALAAVLFLLWLEFYVLPRTPWGRRMFLDKTIEGTSQPPVATEQDDVLGRDATALTALAPSGWVLVNGRRYEARCESGFAEAGATLRVRRIETFHLVVIALN